MQAMQYHPGNNLEVSGDTAENFRQLVEAFQVLSGGYKKGKYENEYRMLQRLQRRKEQGKTKDNNSENDNVSQNLKAILPVYLFEKLAERTGSEQPAMLPVQKEAYKALFSGLDVVLSAPSGSGKTLGFVLPLLAKLAEKGGKEEKETNPEPKSKAKRGRRRKRNRRSRLRSELDALNISCKPPILVLTPTSDVAKEVGKTCSRFHNNSNCVATIFDTPLTKLQPRILHNSDLDIVVGTPGSIKEYAKKGLLDFSRLKTIALDEADTILADPHGRSGIESILKGAAEDYQTILTSTTMTTPLLDFCREVMNMDEKDENFVVLSKNECKDEYEDVLIESTSIEKTRSPIVRHWHTSTRSFDRAIIALDLIATLQPKSCVVFISSQSEAEAVANILALSENTYVSFLSEESTDEARERAVERLRDSKSSVSSLLVTTDTASRDLEFPGVDLVLQFGIPRQPDNNDLYDSTLYANRTRCLGQFGSEAKEADAILLYDQTDEGRLLPGLQTEMEVDDGITINPRALPIPQNILERSYNHAKGICNSFLHLDSVVDCFEKQLQAEMLKLNAERREKELLRRLAVAMTVLSDQNGSNADGK
jgi:superfamily II DNA/RNA helicase